MQCITPNLSIAKSMAKKTPESRPDPLVRVRCPRKGVRIIHMSEWKLEQEQARGIKKGKPQ